MVVPYLRSGVLPRTFSYENISECAVRYDFVMFRMHVCLIKSQWQMSHPKVSEAQTERGGGHHVHDENGR